MSTSTVTAAAYGGGSSISSELRGGEKRKRVLIFGTSGNPPTGRGGHSGLIQYFVKLGEYDKIWVVPVYIHMYEYKRGIMQQKNAPTYKQRFDMCKRCFEKYSTETCVVKVLDIEKQAFDDMVTSGVPPEDVRVGTYDMISKALDMYPNDNLELSFVVGTDAYRDIINGKWKKSKELLEMVNFVVVNRHGMNLGEEELPKETVVHHIEDMTDVSSTAIRNASTEAILQDCSNLDESVLAYMKEHGLYLYGARRERRKKLLQWTLLGVGITAMTVAALAWTGSRKSGRDHDCGGGGNRRR